MTIVCLILYCVSIYNRRYGGCTTVDYGSARSDQLHFIHLDVQSLQLIAWQVLTADGRGRQLAAIDPKRLLSIGFPATFVDQLYF
jgi:hypothetical protein